MANFQRTTIIVALVLLILSLMFIAYVLHTVKNNSKWPPLTGDCPDYWVDLSGNGAQCVNVMDLGTCNTPGKHSTMNFAQAPYVGVGGMCAKYTWATKCGITWDGITSGVSNPCDVSYNKH